MLNTYEEINNKLKTFVDNISDSVLIEYNSDDFTKFNSDDHSYPMLWATPIRMSVVEGQITFIISISIMDIVGEKSEMMKTLSDTAITVGELMSWIDDDSDNLNYFVSLTADFEPFLKDRTNDKVTGWQGQLTFRLAYPANTELIRWKT